MNKLQKGDTVFLLNDGGYSWAYKSYKEVYGIVHDAVDEGAYIYLYFKKNHKPASLCNERRKTWYFLNCELQKCKKPEKEKSDFIVTLFSRIRNWISSRLFCYWEPTALHYYNVSCGCENNISRPKFPICPKCHRIMRIKK